MCSSPIGQNQNPHVWTHQVKAPQPNPDISAASKPDAQPSEKPKTEIQGPKKVSAVNPPEEEAARQAVAAMLDPKHVDSLRGTFASLDEALDFAAKDKGKEVIQAFTLENGQTVYAVQDLQEGQQASELRVDSSKKSSLMNEDGTLVNEDSALEEIKEEIDISETASSNEALSLLGDTSLVLPAEESALSTQEHKQFSAWKEALQREGITPQEAKELSSLLAKLPPQELEKLNSRTATALSPTLQKLLEKIEKSGSWTAYNSLQAITRLAQLKKPGMPIESCDKFLGRMAGTRRKASIQFGKQNQTAAKNLFAQAAQIRAAAEGNPTKLAESEKLEAQARKLNEGSLKRLESEKKDAYRFVKQYEDKGKSAPDYLRRDTAKAAQGVAAAQITQAQTKPQSSSEYPEELVLARENLTFARKVDPDLQLSPQQSVSDEVREHNLEQAQLSRELESADYACLKAQIMGDPQKQKGESLYPLREKRHSLDSAYSHEIAWNENGPENSERNSKLLDLLEQQDSIRAEMAADYAYHKELENSVSGNVRNLNDGIEKLESAQRNVKQNISEIDTAIKKIDSELAEIQLQRQKIINTQTPLVGDLIIAQLDEKAATLLSAKMNKNFEKASLQTQVSELQEHHQTLSLRLDEAKQSKDQTRASLQQWQQSGLAILDQNKMTPGFLSDDLSQMAGGLTNDRLTAVRDTAYLKREALARDILADQEASPEARVNAVESMLDTSRYYGESAEKERYREDVNYNEHKLLNSSERAQKAESILTESIVNARAGAIPEEARKQLLLESIETAHVVSKGMVYSNPEDALKILDQARLLIPEATHNGDTADQLRTEIFESATEQQAILMDPKNLRLLANWTPDSELKFDTNALDAREDFRNQLLSETAQESPGYQEMQTTLALEAEARALFAYEMGQIANRLDKGTAQAIDKSGDFFKQYEDRYDEARPDIFFWQDDAEDAASQLTDVNGEIVKAYDAANGLRHLQAAMGKELSPKEFYALRVQLQWNEIQSSGNAENFMWTLMNESQRDTLMGAVTRFDAQGNQISRDVPASERKALLEKWTKNTGQALQKMLEDTPKPKPEIDGDPRLGSLKLMDKFFIFNDDPATAAQQTIESLAALNGTPTGLSSLLGAGYEEMALQGNNSDEALTTKGLAKELNEEDYEWKSFEKETLPAVIANNILDNVWSSLIPAGWILKGAKAGIAAAKWIAGGIKGAEAARKVGVYGEKALHAIQTLSKYIDPELANKVLNKLKIESTLGKAGANIAFGVGGEFAQMGLEEISPEVAKIYGKYKTTLSFGGTKIFEQDNAAKMLIGLAAIGTEASAHTIIDELVDDPEIRALLKGFVSGVKASVDDKVMPTETHKDSQSDSDSGQTKSPKAITADAVDPSIPKRDTESSPTGESIQPVTVASGSNGGNPPPIDPPPPPGGSGDFSGPRKTPKENPPSLTLDGEKIPLVGYIAPEEVLNNHKLKDYGEAKRLRTEVFNLPEPEGFNKFKAELIERWNKASGNEGIPFGMTDKQLRAHFETLKGLDPRELSAAIGYRNSDAQNMNRIMRGDPSALAEFADEISRIKTNIQASLHSLDKLPKYQGISHRGLSIDKDKADAILDKYRNAEKEGTAIVETQFQSASARDTGNPHLKPDGNSEKVHIRMEFETAKGIDYRTINVDEDEIIMPPGEYLVKSVEKEKVGDQWCYTIKLKDKVSLEPDQSLGIPPLPDTSVSSSIDSSASEPVNSTLLKENTKPENSTESKPIANNPMPSKTVHTQVDSRSWRDANNQLVIQSRLAPAEKRLGFEKDMYPSIEVGLKGWDRSHSQGPGLGNESSKGILYAPQNFNRSDQANGIEAYIKTLFKNKPADKDLVLTTVTAAHPGTRRLKSITYRVDMIPKGAPLDSIKKQDSEKLFEVTLGVSNDRVNPKISREVNYVNPNIELLQ